MRQEIESIKEGGMVYIVIVGSINCIEQRILFGGTMGKGRNIPAFAHIDSVVFRIGVVGSRGRLHGGLAGWECG